MMHCATISRSVRFLSCLPQWSQLKLIPTRKILTMDPDTYVLRVGPLKSVQDCFQNTFSKINWNTEIEETAMDVGCGPGLMTTQLVLPMFTNVKKLFAIDVLPNMIEYAKTHSSHPKIEYSVADMQDWSTVEQWEGCITKLLAIHSFQWMKNQRQAFQNVHRLLHPCGKAGFIMALQAQIFDAVQRISNDTKWNVYFKNVDTYIPESHSKEYHVSHYEEMLKEIGFTILHIDERQSADALSSDLVYKNFFSSVCVLVYHVPAERREEFKEDLFQYLIKEGGRNSEGLPVHVYNMLQLVIKKD